MAPVYASRLGRPVFFGVALVTLALAVAKLVGIALPLWWLLVAAALLVGLVSLGNFYLPSGIFGRPLLRGPSDRPLVALTFDDGPDPVSTRAVLEVLRRHGARATFFVIGERAEKHRELLAELAADGHQIENHSLHHAWSTPFLPRGRLHAELEKTQQIIASVTTEKGAVPRPRWFRPPIGILSPPVVAAARRAGLMLCGWSCKARDGLRSTEMAAALARLEAGLVPGAILLLHDAAERGGHAPVAPAVLEKLLPLLAARGLSAVTIDELVGTRA